MRNICYSSLLCFIIALLVCLSMGFGSWLETNNLFYTATSSISQHFSVFNLVLYSPLNETNSVHLTFGLWRYCIHDTSSNKSSFLCSPVKINFDIDTISIISNIANSNGNQQLPTLSASSYVRLVPLLLATLVAVISLGVCLVLLPGNSKKTLQRRALFLFTSFLSFIGATLSSITFGITFSQYATNIESACSSLLIQQRNHVDGQYICSSYTPGIEIILLALSVGLFFISTVCCIICSTSRLTKSSRMQYTNTGSNFSIYTDMNQSHQELEVPSSTMNEKIIADEYNNEAQQPQRMSLRPPPPNQKRAKCGSIIVDDKLPAHSLADVSNADSVVPVTVTGLLPITPSSEFLVYDDILLPPNLPFASRQNNQSRGSSNQNRPLSNGSNNTFGALCGNGNHPSSPSADETASQASSYIDLHHNLHYRNDSNISAGALTPTNTNNSNSMYATGTSTGTMSNHTLGGTLCTNSKLGGYYGNSSFSGDEDDKINNELQPYTRPRQFGSTSSSMHSSIIPDNPSAVYDSMLYKRIEDYRHIQDKKKDSSSTLSN